MSTVNSNVCLVNPLCLYAIYASDDAYVSYLTRLWAGVGVWVRVMSRCRRDVSRRGRPSGIASVTLDVLQLTNVRSHVTRTLLRRQSTPMASAALVPLVSESDAQARCTSRTASHSTAPAPPPMSHPHRQVPHRCGRHRPLRALGRSSNLRGRSEPRGLSGGPRAGHAGAGVRSSAPSPTP